MPPVDRRLFLKTAAAVAVTAGAADAAPKKTAADAETLTTTFYKSLTPQQKSAICFGFDHPLRSRVEANWHIVPNKIGEFYTPDQQAMLDEIFRKLHNPDFVVHVMRHMEEDGGGLSNAAVALFGEPGAGKFEIVFSGRHCTARCDGDSVEGAAFGGPIFYGHQSGPNGAEPADHPGNVYWFQAKRANQVFQALDGKQREIALLTDMPRKEASTKTVQLRTKAERFAGLPVSEMSKDQRALVGKVLADLLLPFRKRDTDEAMRIIKSRGGVESLSMSFYRSLDIGEDGMWDVWQLESENMVWYFRGHPHVHTWVNIRA